MAHRRSSLWLSCSASGSEQKAEEKTSPKAEIYKEKTSPKAEIYKASLDLPPLEAKPVASSAGAIEPTPPVSPQKAEIYVRKAQAKVRSESAAAGEGHGRSDGGEVPVSLDLCSSPAPSSAVELRPGASPSLGAQPEPPPAAAAADAPAASSRDSWSVPAWASEGKEDAAHHAQKLHHKTRADTAQELNLGHLTPRAVRAHLDPLGAAAAMPWQVEVSELIDAGKSNGWYVICSANVKAEEPLELEGGALQQVAAVLVVGTLEHVAKTCEVLGRLRATGYRLPPVIATLVGAPLQHPGQRTAIIRAQHEFLASGADDVLLKKVSLPVWSIEVAMSIARDEAKQVAKLELKKRLQSQYEEKMRQLIQVAEQSARNRKDNLFWQSAHKLFGGFPALEGDLTDEPGIGSLVGPCELDKHAGSGSFGIVFHSVNKETGEEEAVKVLQKEKMVDVQDVHDVWKEIKILERINHDRIVGFRGVHHGPEHIFIRMELVGPNMYKALKVAGRFPLRTSRKFQGQLVSAVAHCSDRRVAHLDLKPENLALCDDGVKVLDFGSAVHLGKRCRGIVGTMPFIAPEVLAAGEERPYDASACDVWSSSVVLLEMLCGLGKLEDIMQWGKGPRPSPRRFEELREAFRDFAFVQKAIEHDLRMHLGEDLVEFFKGTLVVDSAQRWTAHQASESAWLTAGRPP